MEGIDLLFFRIITNFAFVDFHKRLNTMTYRDFWHNLAVICDEHEAQSMARWVYERRFGLTFADICAGKDALLTADEQQDAADMLGRLLKKEPVQYVLGEADFCDRTFHVERGVLIPRPETAQLTRTIIADNERKEGLHVLDVGTGSGCIAITLALELHKADVTAFDISPEALTIAQGNAEKLGAKVRFEECDILSEKPEEATLDIIVSNPPYICEKERNSMEANVLGYEPELALFVDNASPLLFYHAISRYAATALRPDGVLYYEVNPEYAQQVADDARQAGLSQVEISTDLFGKQRFIKAKKPCDKKK